MNLRTTPVSKCLDKKLILLGFEVPDILAIFITLSTLNFLFGGTQLKSVFVWFPTLALALTIYLGKRGKPDNHLVHWVRFQIRPGKLSAFYEPSDSTPPPKLRRKP